MKNHLVGFAFTLAAVASVTFANQSRTPLIGPSATRMAEASAIALGSSLMVCSTEASVVPHPPLAGATLTLIASDDHMTLMLENRGPRPIYVWVRGGEPESSLTLEDMDIDFWRSGGPLVNRGYCGTGIVSTYVPVEPGQKVERQITYEGVDFWWRPHYPNLLQLSVRLRGEELFSNPVTLPPERFKKLHQYALATWEPWMDKEDEGRVYDSATVISEDLFEER